MFGRSNGRAEEEDRELGAQETVSNRGDERARGRAPETAEAEVVLELAFACGSWCFAFAVLVSLQAGGLRAALGALAPGVVLLAAYLLLVAYAGWLGWRGTEDEGDRFTASGLVGLLVVAVLIALPDSRAIAWSTCWKGLCSGCLARWGCGRGESGRPLRWAHIPRILQRLRFGFDGAVARPTFASADVRRVQSDIAQDALAPERGTPGQRRRRTACLCFNGHAPCPAFASKARLLVRPSGAEALVRAQVSIVRCNIEGPGRMAKLVGEMRARQPADLVPVAAHTARHGPMSAEVFSTREQLSTHAQAGGSSDLVGARACRRAWQVLDAAEASARE